MLKRIDFSRTFNKQLKKAPLSVKISFRDRLQLFIQDKYNPLLNNHALTGQFQGHRSINITGDWRAIFREYEGKQGMKAVIFYLLGTHSQLYG